MPRFRDSLSVWILSAGLVAAIPREAVRGAVSLVSQSGLPGGTTVRDLGAATTSADGNFLIFLGTGDVGDSLRVSLYRRRLADGASERVAVASGDSVSAYSASRDGRRVAFACSISTGVPAGQSPYRTQVFLKDFDTGELRLVSADTSGLPGNAESGEPVLSADGRRLLFESRASNLGSEPDAHRVADVFLYEVDSGNLRLLSRASDGALGDQKSGSVALSDDGSVAVYRSDATNLRPSEPGLSTDLYVWSGDTQSSRRIHLTGTAPGGSRPDARGFNVVLSPDGRRLAFRSDARSQSPAHGVWWFDLETWTPRRASERLEVAVFGDDTGGPVMAAGGNRLAFETLASPGRTVIWDADSGLHTLDELAILASPNGGAPTNCRAPVLSPGGEWLAFVTEAAVPAAGAPNSGARRLYVRRLLTGETWTPLPGVHRLRLFEIPFVEFVTGGGIHFQSDASIPELGDVNEGLDVAEVSGPGGSGSLLTPRVPRAGVGSGNSASHLGPGAASLDGRWVVFASTANDLVTGDTNEGSDVFVRDLVSGATRRVSVRSDGEQANAESWTPRISGNGRFVAFMSTASNLVDGDTNGAPDIFVRDLVAGTTALASARDGGMDVPSFGSFNPVISADGRYVAFESRAGDLVPGLPLLLGTNVFRRDMLEQRTRLLSANPSQPFRRIEGRARSPMMSDDGRTVAFIAGDSFTTDLYLHSLAEDGPVAASSGFGNVTVAGAALSADGTRAVYFRRPPGSGLWRRDNVTSVSSAVPGLEQLTDISELAISGNGRLAAFVSKFQPEGSSDTNGLRDVFVVDLDTGAVRSVSAPSAAEAANGASDSPVFSTDGRRIAFRTRAGNLDGNSPASSWNIAVRDLTSDRVALVSRRDSDQRLGSESSGRPLLTGDGGSVLFQSFDPLVPGDANGTSDVFIAPFPPATVVDTDGDSMPDDWERVYFGNLGRDGSADFDGDGTNDRDEYITGTNPTVLGSVFRVTAVTGQGGGPLNVSFLSVVGVTYRLQTTHSLAGAAFESVGMPTPGSGDPMTFAIPVEASSGLFRVVAFR